MAEKNYKKQGAEAEVALEETFIQKNLKKIGIAVSCIIILVLVCFLGQLYLNSQNEKAADALYPCQEQFQLGNYEKALNGDGQNVLGFAQVAKEYSLTKSGNVAKLYAGLANAQLGNYEEAEKFLKDFNAKDDEMISPSAIGALGNVYAQLGQHDKAVDCLKKAAQKADNTVLSPIFLVQAGEILEADGKTEEALKLYQEVKDNYRGSQLGAEIDKYIERVKK